MQFSLLAAAPPDAVRRAMSSPPPLPAAIDIAPTPTGALITLTPANAAGDPHAWRHYLAQLASSAASLHFAESLPAAVNAYIRAWNETDPAARAALLESCWEPHAVFKDGMGVADGRDALHAYIAAAQQFVPGFHLELAAPPEQCHGVYRFSWLIRKPDGSPMARGSNFGQLSLAGRFLSATGFWDKA